MGIRVESWVDGVECLQKERAGHTRCFVLRGVIVPCNTGLKE
jgi:hypothetical protein